MGRRFLGENRKKAKEKPQAEAWGGGEVGQDVLRTVSRMLSALR